MPQGSEHSHHGLHDYQWQLLLQKYCSACSSLDGYRNFRLGLVGSIALLVGGYIAFGVTTHSHEGDLALLSYWLVDVVLCASWSFNDIKEHNLKLYIKAFEQEYLPANMINRFLPVKKSWYEALLGTVIAPAIGIGTLASIMILVAVREWPILNHLKSLSLPEILIFISFSWDILVVVLLLFILKPRS